MWWLVLFQNVMAQMVRFGCIKVLEMTLSRDGAGEGLPTSHVFSGSAAFLRNLGHARVGSCMYGVDWWPACTCKFWIMGPQC